VPRAALEGDSKARKRGLYRRKDSRFWWIGLVLPDGRRVCQSTGCINRTDAENYAVRLKNEAIEAQQQGLLGIFVWQQAVVRYLEEFVDKRSLSDDRDHLRKLDPYLRSLKLDAIDMAALQPFIRDRKLKDGVSNATINRALEVVRRILNVAHQDWRWLKGVPKIRMLKEPRRRVRFLRREEADRLIEALPSHMKPIVEFALATGCRAGEILGLEWSRVDLTRKVAWLDHGTTKSGDGRGIPLNADAVAALEATRGQHPRWCFTFSGKRIQQSSTAWGLAKQRAGIEDFRFHDLRHTWASWHVQSGTSLPELMELGGWKSYEMVLRYAHLAPEKLSFVAGRIERQPLRSVEEALRGEKRSKKRYVRRYGRALMLGKFLINWCARRDSNSRPPGS
jgi:integrase